MNRFSQKRQEWSFGLGGGFAWTTIMVSSVKRQKRKLTLIEFSIKLHMCIQYTVKPVLSDLSKINKIKVLKANGSLMKVQSIAECSP